MTEPGEIRREPLRDRRWFLRHGVPVAVLVLHSAKAAGAEQAGTVEEIKGEAFAAAANVRRTLDREAAIFLGDDVGTERESRLSMRLGRDTTIRLGEQARVKIERYLVDAGGQIVLNGGARLL